MEIEQIIEKITADFSLDSSVTIAPETELLMSGLVDSFGVVRLVAWLEDEMGTPIDPGLIVLENFDRPAAIFELCSQVSNAATA